ncbi:MAG TPA: glycosyltransferase, partial [Planctomycetaceae bacterium]|nr:glycosyltransferase [Planctomycetaceae bacterium]
MFASPIGGLGGAELFLLEMLEELRLRAPDWELHLVAGSDGPLLARAEALGVTCHLEPFPPELAVWGDSSAKTAAGSATGNMVTRGLKVCSAVLRYRRRLRSLIRRIDPDRVHSNGLKFHALTGLAGCGEARLVWFMHDYLGSRRLLSRILPWLARSVDLVWANSQSVADDIQKLLPSRRVEILYCGIDLGTFAPGPSEADWLEDQCEPAGDRSPALRIGLVATYARWKGQDQFLQAAAELLRRKPAQSVRFYIIGGPIYESAGSQFTREELTQQAAELGLADSVRFVPFQREISRVYRSLDVVVHASRHPEPFGRT